MIALTLLWTIATMIWTGRPLKVTTMILPSLLIANGSSYAIHFLAQYYRVLTKAYVGEQSEPGSTAGSRILQNSTSGSTDTHPCSHIHFGRHDDGRFWISYLHEYSCHP